MATRSTSTPGSASRRPRRPRSGWVDDSRRTPRTTERTGRSRAGRRVARVLSSKPMEYIRALRAIVGDAWVFTQQHQLRAYESDGLLQYAQTPAVAVLP